MLQAGGKLFYRPPYFLKISPGFKKMASSEELKGVLVLEDGSIFEGRGLGAVGGAFGEVVFNTSMTGYQEALTDPSYNGQILLMTYPLQGNYGVSPGFTQSERVWVRGFVALRCSPSLSEYLRENGVPGVQIPQTREVTLKIRERGTMMGAVITYRTRRFLRFSPEEVLEHLSRTPHPAELNLVGETSTVREVVYPSKKSSPRIVLWDFGVKRSILNHLRPHGEVIRVPWDTTPERIAELNPNLIVLSNGPGDPGHPALKSVVRSIRRLAEEGYPIFGICLGHQLLSLSLGGTTYKLRFGHRGSNHPVEDLLTGRVYITSQNHGYAVSENSLPGDLLITHKNLNDRTVEGISSEGLKVWGLQFHPEGGPGPHDTRDVFPRAVKWALEGGGH